ncbi:MAG: hypothetical protein ICV59_04400 [Thermoleophilia bacterium]|nr:hypothetical protein [Thermoleophilia bacterium]
MVSSLVRTGRELLGTARETLLRNADPRYDGYGSDDGTRLLLQIGMMLGLVYLAFLVAWFHVTRIRWNRRI